MKNPIKLPPFQTAKIATQINSSKFDLETAHASQVFLKKMRCKCALMKTNDQRRKTITAIPLQNLYFSVAGKEKTGLKVKSKKLRIKSICIIF